MADEGTDSTQAPTEVVENSSNPELEAARAELKQAQETNKAQRDTFNLHRQQYEQRIQQANQQQNYGSGYEQPQQDADQQQMQRRAEQDEAQREAIGKLTYRSNNPDWAEYDEEVNAIISDPVKVQDVVSADRFGNPDYAKSYQNAKMQVENKRLKAIQLATADAKAAAKTEQDRQKGQATISGTGAGEVDEGIDVDGLSSDEMLEQGMVEDDPLHPIKPLNPKVG